jgi:hypothetical protein
MWRVAVGCASQSWREYGGSELFPFSENLSFELQKFALLTLWIFSFLFSEKTWPKRSRQTLKTACDLGVRMHVDTHNKRRMRHLIQ